MNHVRAGSLLVASLLLFGGIAWSQAPRDRRPDPRPEPEVGGLIPADIRADLDLTPDQEKQIADLEAETRRKLDRILTASQRKRLEEASRDEDHGRPVAAVARELGVTPQQFREAFRKVNPAGAGQEPTHEQRVRNRKVLAEALGVSPERLDEVMDKYRPGGRGTNGPPPPPRR